MGVEGNRPFIGKDVLYVDSDRSVAPAVVMKVYPDGWTVDLHVHGGEDVDRVRVDEEEKQELMRDSWTTRERYEGVKIWAPETAATVEIPDAPPDDL